MRSTKTFYTKHPIIIDQLKRNEKLEKIIKINGKGKKKIVKEDNTEGGNEENENKKNENEERDNYSNKKGKYIIDLNYPATNYDHVND